jgi:hypothetical protein
LAEAFLYEAAPGKFLVKMPGAMLKCEDRSSGHTQPENPDADSERRMSRQVRAQQKYLVRKYSDQKEIKTNLGDVLKKALEKNRIPTQRRKAFILYICCSGKGLSFLLRFSRHRLALPMR